MKVPLLIAKNQWRRWIRQRSVVVGLAALGLLQAGTLLGGWLQQQRTQTQRQLEQALVREQWEEQPDRHPHRVAHYGYFARRIPSPLAFFDPGVSRLTGHSVYLEAHHQNPANYADAALQVFPQRLAWLDLASLLRVILPLFLIFAGYGVLSTEDELGTASLGRALGVSRRQLVFGKLLALSSLGLVLVSPTLLLGAGGLVSIAMQPGRADAIVRGVALGALYIGWIGLIASLVVAVSHALRSSRGALGGLVAGWVLLALLLPRLASNIGSTVFPAPSTAEFQSAVHEDALAGGDSHNPNDPRFAKLKKEYLERYGVERVEDLPINFGGVVMTVGEKHTTDVYRRHLNDLRSIYASQNAIPIWLGVLDPFVAVRHLSMALAGTNSAHAFDFVDQAEDYRYELVQALNELHTEKIKFQNDRAQRLDVALYQALPTFDYRAQPLSRAMANEWLSLIGLLVWLGLVAALLLRVPGAGSGRPAKAYGLSRLQPESGN
ncbi:MAG: DUF3526 domain-containing protein [Myxococcota bacterium]